MTSYQMSDAKDIHVHDMYDIKHTFLGGQMITGDLSYYVQIATYTSRE